MPRKTVKRKGKGRKTRSSSKRKLAGFTKTKGKFALVFKRGNKLSVGKGRFKSKKALLSRAKKFLS